MKQFLLLMVVGIAFATNYHLRQSAQCTTSNDCSTSAPCCRDANGQAIVHQEGGFGGIEPHLGSSQGGSCSSLLGTAGNVCDSSCGCQTGYKCYRQMSGVCCPPMRCYNATWVEQQQHYWANCHPPKCFLPP